MKRSAVTVIAAACLAVGTVGAIGAAPANALTVRPSSAPLLDTSGAASGCRASVSGAPAASPTEGPLKGAPGYVGLTFTMSCSHHWRADTMSERWQSITADGKKGTIFPLGSGKSWAPDDSVPSPEPITQTGSSVISPCLVRTDGNVYYPGRSKLPWLLTTGQHDVILGGTAKVNEFKSDGHPYSATVEKLYTVRCTSARAAYR